jgi:proteic killer suppression protein
MAIPSFGCRDTRALFLTGKSRRFGSILKVAARKLDMLDAAHVLTDLRQPPGNHLEALKDDPTGQHSIRINDQWRICFVWTDSGPANVGIVDYH